MDFEREEGEAAFYGPKVDFLVQDVIGREWQLGTAQLDYVLPERFGLQYIGADNEPHRPVMIHRAPFGSFERFIGILIEHTGGDFPLWLAPVQVAILPITERHLDYGRKVQTALGRAGIRAELDSRNEKLGFKIREAELQKIPVMAVVGDEETSRGTVTPRRRGRGKKGGEAIGLEAFAASLTEEIQRRGR
jgi:threonyl-tRNA synthetase